MKRTPPDQTGVKLQWPDGHSAGQQTDDEKICGLQSEPNELEQFDDRDHTCPSCKASAVLSVTSLLQRLEMPSHKRMRRQRASTDHPDDATSRSESALPVKAGILIQTSGHATSKPVAMVTAKRDLLGIIA